MGFYPPDSLVHEAQRKGMEILPPCVARSGAECVVEEVSRPAGSRLAVRLGMGYVGGVKEGEVRAMVAERDSGGAWRSLGDLAGRSGASAETLGRLAWAGACDSLVEGPVEDRRRQALWTLGVAVPGTSVQDGTQLALPLEPHDGPELRALSAWERMLADYGSTGVTLREHPLELMRPGLPGDLRTSTQLESHPHGRRVRVAGLVVARQRPATAKGIMFMLLEDEHGTINLILPARVQERCRLAARAGAARAGDGAPRAARGDDQRGGRSDRPPRAPRPPTRGDPPHRAPPHLVERGGEGGRRLPAVAAGGADTPPRRRTCARSPRRPRLRPPRGELDPSVPDRCRPVTTFRDIAQRAGAGPCIATGRVRM